jgi:hypothetical protein
MQVEEIHVLSGVVIRVKVKMKVIISGVIGGGGGGGGVQEQPFQAGVILK